MPGINFDHPGSDISADSGAMKIDGAAAFTAGDKTTLDNIGATGGDIASASPLVIGTDGDSFDVTGTTNFAAITVAADRHFFTQFDAILTMTHGASMSLPGAANITTAAGDIAEWISTAANTVRCVNYTKVDGTAISGASAFKQIGYDLNFHFAAGCSGSVSTITAIANQIYYFPVEFHSPHTFTRIGVNVQTAAGSALARFGLYTGTNGVPATKILDAGTVDCSTTGQKLISISQAIIPGAYFFAVICDTAAVAFYRVEHLDGGARAMFYLGRSPSTSKAIYFSEAGSGNVLPASPSLTTVTSINDTPNVFLQEF